MRKNAFDEALRNLYLKRETCPLIKKVKKKSLIPPLSIGIFFLLYSLIFPFHNIFHYLLCALLSAGVFAVASFIFKDKVSEIEVEDPIDVKDKKAAEYIRSAQAHLADIKAANAKIPDETASKAIFELEDSCRQLILGIKDNPDQASLVSESVEYFLPNVSRLLDKYAGYVQSGANDETTQSAKSGIIQTIGKVTEVFKKQLADVRRNEAMNLKADMQVIEMMMSAQGLGKNIMKSPKSENRADKGKAASGT